MIRKATAADLDGVAEIYTAILDREEATGHHWTNWQRGVYPCRATAEKALSAGTLYVDEEAGHILGCANLNQVQPAEYAKIPWQISARPREALVIHTLCIHPRASGRGLGRRFVAFAEGLAAGKGVPGHPPGYLRGQRPRRRLLPQAGLCPGGQDRLLLRGLHPRGAHLLREGRLLNAYR